MQIGVIGAGSWGTALSALLSAKNYPVTLWAYEEEVAKGINSRHKNPLYLTDFDLPQNLVATSDIKKATKGKDVLVFVVPSHVTRQTAKRLSPYIGKETVFVSCTKGIEIETGKLISNVLAEEIKNLPKDNFCFLSGPSFAREVAQRLPTTVVIAGGNAKITRSMQDIFRTDYFMAFTGEDVIGVQVGGAVKNVIAIACGISDGLLFGHNTRAAIITRGLYEMIKIGKALGANPFTFAGLAGIGDLILTCTSELSRNRQLGLQIGQGKKLSAVKMMTRQVAEGVSTADAVFRLINKLNIVAPICTETYKMLYKDKPARQAVYDLTKMEVREEFRSIL